MSYRRFLQLHEVIKRYDTQGRNAKRARKGEGAVELSHPCSKEGLSCKQVQEQERI